jgi:hypothetical protein
MFERLKRSLVDSYVGAIAMGWLLATAVLDFVSIFSSPVQFWISRNEYRTLNSNGPVGFQPQDALPEVVKTILVLILWYVLFRWLYFKPVKISSAEASLDVPSKD